jgi:hypothetical protein
MDFGSTLVVGGQILIDLTGPSSFASVTPFEPTVFFTSLAGGIATNFSPAGSKPSDAEFQISISAPFELCGSTPCPSLITGLQKLGDLNFDVGGVGLGVIDLSEGDVFGLRGESFAEDLTGADIAMAFMDGAITAVPLPTSAWLFATGMGLAGFWRRRRV